MTNFKLKIAVLVFLFLSLGLFAQITHQTPLGAKTISHKIYSKNKKEYVLNITFPRNYDAKKNYKSLYYLDAFWLKDLTLGSYTILELCDYVEDVVFVGISLNGSQEDWHKQRDLDFTPSPFRNLGLLQKLKNKHTENNIEISVKTGKGNQLNKNNTGGANVFVNILENDIIQYIEKKYPNLNKSRGLLGHSFGGLFGFYVLQNRPDLFQDLLLISGSLSWNSSELVNNAKFTKLKTSKNNIQLYHSYGTNEVKGIRIANDQIKELITSLQLENLKYKFDPIPNTNHHSVLSRAIYDGLLYLYKK
ncbi:Alpha/beta hydrolase [Tenacibaculum sp. 190130A14a]|uniref:Alpha/beta hydrolase n=1 Tax=Tenacibaculum polynesiense TaxID=3137857 RepID=A0ABM9PC80_9FLAO